ncbi:MAG: nitronate monooxygenase [Actinomycetota bacterium]|nr:nitronate monooxygenase [Actinomycetota bacterium]
MQFLAEHLGLSLPVLAAPMSGGPGSLDLVRAAADAGSMGFLAAGYKTPQAVSDEIAVMTASRVPFGVNLFVPHPLPIEAGDLRAYAHMIVGEAARYGLTLDDSVPVDESDHWHDKIDILCAQPAPVVSFTFAIPGPADLARLHAAGAFLIQTVTTVDEARAAAEASIDALAVQAPAAGGHSATFTPRRPLTDIAIGDLVAAVRHAVGLPVIAAGGLGTADAVAAVLRAGADAVAVGTVLLRSNEAGTTSTHRSALADPRRTGTVITHAFTGRPARALPNDFTERYSDQAPFGYPAIHQLTSALRKAAASAGDPERVHLWAGTGYRHATEEPVATILTRLSRRR